MVKEIRIKVIEHELATDRWEPLRARAFAGEVLSDEEEKRKDKYVMQRKEIGKWFLENTDSKALRKVFGSYLELPEDLSS